MPYGSMLHFLLKEKNLIEEHYDFLKCSIIKLSSGIPKLQCKGKFKPTSSSVEYEYCINYVYSKRPDVYVYTSGIEYCSKIHVYSDKSLCLYYPGDLQWSNKVHLYNTIIPWTHEWFVFYELYLISGRWEHPYVSHNRKII